MDAAYQALRESAAWIDVSARGKIVARGRDRARLLHAMTTNHVQQLRPGQGCYAFFLTPQGRILSDVNLFCFEDRFLLDLEPETRDKIYRHLSKYIIADDVTLEDASDAMGAIAVEGPRAHEVLTWLGLPLPAEPFGHVTREAAFVARVDVTGAGGFRLYVPTEKMTELAGRLSGVVRADDQAARVVRLEHALPRYGEDIFETTLPQETQQMRALHFSKGCYIGQEIVERIRSRGHVNRLLVGLEIEGTQPPAPRTPLTADAAEAGETTSAAFSPSLGKVVALGYVRAQLARPGTSLLAGAGAAVTTPVGGQAQSAGC